MHEIKRGLCYDVIKVGGMLNCSEWNHPVLTQKIINSRIQGIFKTRGLGNNLCVRQIIIELPCGVKATQEI